MNAVRRLRPPILLPILLASAAPCGAAAQPRGRAPAPPFDPGLAVRPGFAPDRPAPPAAGKIAVRFRDVGALVKLACSGADEAYRQALPCADPGWYGRNADRIAARMGPRAFSAGAGPATAADNLCTALLAVTPPPTARVGAPITELLAACRPGAPLSGLVERACLALAAKRADPDLAAAAARYEAALGCASGWWRGAGGARFPGGSLCDAVIKTPDVEPLRALPAVADLHAACGRSERAFGIAGATTLLLPLIYGTGDFLQERARDELLSFAVDRLGRDFCAPEARGGGPAIRGAALFPASCADLFPDGINGDANIESIQSGRFQRVIAGELLGVPLRLLSPSGIPASGPDEERIWIIAHALGAAIRDAVAAKQPTVEFLAGLEPRMFQALGDRAPHGCVGKGSAPASVPCALLLVFSVASRAGEALSPDERGDLRDGAPDGAAWIDGAAAHFCRRYGGDPAAVDATCLAGGSGPLDPALWARMRAMVDASASLSNALADVQTAHEAAIRGGRPPYEAALEAATGVTRAIDDFTGRAVEIAETMCGGAAPGLVEARRALDPAADLLQAATAAARRDFRAVAAGLRAVLSAKAVSARLDPSFKRGLAFVLDIAEARTRDDVKRVIADSAAPLGSYRAKYQARRTLVALNGFVGSFAGAAAPLWRSGDHGRYRDPGPFSAQALAAPLGIDVSFPAIPCGPAGEQANHLGVAILLVDPLAIRVAEAPAAADTRVDFRGVLAPSVFLRWGILRSPVVLMVGARVQPLLTSIEQACGASSDQPCWRAPVSVLGGLAVDVPILPIH